MDIKKLAGNDNAVGAIFETPPSKPTTSKVDVVRALLVEKPKAVRTHMLYELERGSFGPHKEVKVARELTKAVLSSITLKMNDFFTAINTTKKQ